MNRNAVILVVIAVVTGISVVAYLSVSILGAGGLGITGPPGELDHHWTGTIDTDYDDNHHDLAAAVVDGEPVIAVPMNDLDGGSSCGLLTLSADGAERWAFDIPTEHCTPHAVGSVAVGNRTGDGLEFLLATEMEELIGLDADDGAVTLRHEVGQMGYSQPLIADVTGDETPETIVVGFSGAVHVLDDEGDPLWRTELDGTTPADPIAADLTGDGETELAIAQRAGRNGEVVVFDGDGTIRWRATVENPVTTWAVVGNSDRAATDGALLVASGRSGTVVTLNGSSGTRRWAADVADSRLTLASQPDGTILVAGDGAVRALDPADGDGRWTQSFDGTADAAAPVVGDLDDPDGDLDDDAPEIAVAFRDGTVAVLDSDSGDVLALEEVDGSIYVSPLLVDLDGDESDEVVLFTGDGRIEAYDYDSGDG